MVKVETLRDDGFKRILRCREGNRIWYQMWLTESDWYEIHNHIKINLYNTIAIKYWWLPNLQFYYVFFYEKKGGKVRGVLGKENTNYILNSIL
jgi:hypothetical protein